MRQIYQPIIGILAYGLVAGKLAMIDPHIG